MYSKDYKYYFLLIFSIVFFESIAQYHIKKSKIKNNNLYLLVAFLSYSIVCLLLNKCYDFNGMGITNFVWSVLSIVTMLIIGVVAFNEDITKYDLIGIVISMIGLYLIFIYDHKD
jgi:multidrug transporter EmrE-like cation transporter